MPEISDAQYRTLVRYEGMGTPDEIEKKISDLTKDNGKQRDTIRDLEGKVPKEGSVVIPKEKAATFEAIEKIGKTADEITAALDAGKKAEEKVAVMEWRDSARAAAVAAGLNPEAFVVLPGVREYAFKVETKKDRDGKDVTTAYATKAGEQGAQAVAIDDAFIDARAEWKPLRPALQAKAKDDDADGTRWASQAQGDPPTDGTKTPEQLRAGKAASGAYAAL